MRLMVLVDITDFTGFVSAQWKLRLHESTMHCMEEAASASLVPLGSESAECLLLTLGLDNAHGWMSSPGSTT